MKYRKIWANNGEKNREERINEEKKRKERVKEE